MVNGKPYPQWGACTDNAANRSEPLGVNLGMRDTFEGLSVAELRYEPGARLARHAHARASLSLMIWGNQRESIGGRWHDCPVNSAVLKSAWIDHVNAVGPRGARGLFIEMSAERMESLATAKTVSREAECFADDCTRRLVRRVGMELRLRQPGSDLIVEGLLFELLGMLARKRAGGRGRKGDAWLMRAMDYLESNFRKRITMTELAVEAGVHPSHLAVVFRERHAMSVGEWVRNRRLEFARKALQRGTEPISGIAFEAGFSDQSHLTRAFHGHFGMTPAEYRRSLS